MVLHQKTIHFKHASLKCQDLTLFNSKINLIINLTLNVIPILVYSLVYSGGNYLLHIFPIFNNFNYHHHYNYHYYRDH